jgi:myo-inositol 2-dehydrogenase/D-chiro-inositol 1-dehydrogenase
MGSIHAHHVLELAQETDLCELVAICSAVPEHAEQFLKRSGRSIPVFPSVEELASANICDATIIATSTALHREHAETMLNAQQRIFLEKPLTGSLLGDQEFVAYLEREHPQGVMLGFQRRFDAPLNYAKQLLDAGVIGRPFKIFSAMEDSAPAPDGFRSPGLLADMGIHNVDEILWFSGRLPDSAFVIGSRIYSHRLTTCVEDFDDATLLLNFGTAGDALIAEIQVGRNHVSGYRCETVIFGEKGQICIGRFYGNPREVLVEVYGRAASSDAAERRSFPSRAYSDPLPEFADRFGAAYKQELRTFIECCLEGRGFPVTHLHGLRAQEVIQAGMTAILKKEDMAKICFGSLTAPPPQ